MTSTGIRIAATIAIAFLAVAALFALLNSQAVSAQAEPPNLTFGKIAAPGDVLTRAELRTDPQPAWVGFYFVFDAPPGETTQGWNLTWTHNVAANGSRLTQQVRNIGSTDARAVRHLYYRLDPCQVAGIDMPGTEIGVTWEFVFAASHPRRFFNPPPAKGKAVLKLAPDMVAPEFKSVHAPSKVRRDETVQIDIAVTDVSDQMGGDLAWDSALHLLSLEGPSGPGQPGTQHHRIDDSYPRTCSDKVNSARHSFSYTVPHSAQPGDEIRLNARVEDWSGNKGEQEIVLKIEEPAPEEDEQAGDTPFPPRSGCREVGKSIYRYQGLKNKCTGWLSVCSATIEIGCPFSGFQALATSERGPAICCDDWRAARESRRPCDVDQDADCDGIKNKDDNDPLRSGSPPPRKP